MGRIIILMLIRMKNLFTFLHMDHFLQRRCLTLLFLAIGRKHFTNFQAKPLSFITGFVTLNLPEKEFFSSNHQSITLSPFVSRIAFVLLKGFDPKNPCFALSGEGCALSITNAFENSTIPAFLITS